MFDQYSNLFNGIVLILASLGLSLSAGVRAYLPVMAVGIASDVGNIGGIQIHLLPQFSWVGNPLFLVLMGFLTLYEISADKIPLIDHLNDTIHTVIRPLSGALIFTCTSNALTNTGQIGMIIAAIIGGSLAATTHAAKAGVIRPATTVTTFGLGNPLVSLAEDALVIFTVILTFAVPVLAAILFLVLLFFVGKGLATLIKRRRAKKAQERLAVGAMRASG
jgi:hypothetical protein